MPRECDPARLTSQGERKGKAWQSKQYSMEQVEHLVRLLKKGNAPSLAQIRQGLGKTRQEVALKIGVSANQIEQWEKEQEVPSKTHYAQWKVKLSYYIDEAISGLLGTEDKEINTRFWEVMWRLID